jgi:hypothetical protein
VHSSKRWFFYYSVFFHSFAILRFEYFRFRWWWAFTKKHSIISLYYENQAAAGESGEGEGTGATTEKRSASNKPFRRPASTSSPPVDSVLNLSTSSQQQQRSSPPLLPSPAFSLLVPFLSSSNSLSPAASSPARYSSAAQLAKSYAH